MTDPIGTAQERELIEGLCEKRPLSKLALDKVEALGRLSGDSPWLVNPLGEQAADALLSRIAEVGELREALDDCVASLAAIRATADNPDEWALSAEHFSTACLESLKVARAALSLQRRV